MGINWNEGLMRWVPHIDAAGKEYPLNHLHPFRYPLMVNNGADRVEVEIRVTFAMHCFTRGHADGDTEAQFYRDLRETRTFCPARYELSPRLPVIARELATRKCGYAKDKNYVTVDVQTADGGATTRYGVFFNVIRVKDADGLAVLLTIQSAYELSPDKQLPNKGSIRFTRLIELTLDGIKPRPPR